MKESRDSVQWTVPATPVDEAERLAALYSFALLDTLAEPGFDALTQLAAEICGVPIALVSLVDRDRQWFKSVYGLPGVTQTSRDASFCAHSVADRQPLEVPDTHKDERFRSNPLVVGQPNIRFYAGYPLDDGAGHLLGTLCVIDRQPRRLDAHQWKMLAHLAKAVESMFDWRRRGLTTSARLGALLDGASSEIFVIDPVSLHYTYANRGALENTGYSLGELQKIKIGGLFESIDLENLERELRALARGVRKRVALETICRRKDGTDYVCRGSFHYHGDADPPMITAICENITDQKRVEQELQTYVTGLTAVINIQHELAVGGSDLNSLMRLIVVRAKEIVGARGAVIETVDDSELVYRAATDDAMSEVGTRRKLEGDFSALALSEGRAVRCNESNADPRVDRATCARLGVRSMVVAPFYREHRAVGTLKVFSGKPQAFTDQSTQLVQLLASTLGSAMQRQVEEQAFLEIARGATIETGSGFFNTLVTELAGLLETPHVFIGERTTDGNSIRIAAMNNGADLRDDQEFPIVGTPIERMLDGEMFYQANGLKALFPNDPLIALTQTEAYLGLPLLAGDRSVIGVIGAMFASEVTSPDRIRSVLEIFAARAASELERQRTDLLLREQTQLMQSVLDGIADGVTVADPDGRIVLMNPAARRMVGVPVVEGITLDKLPQYYGLYRADGVTPFPSEELAILEALRGQSTDGVQMVVRNPAIAEGIVINVDARPLIGVDGELRGAVAVSRDVTRLKRSEDQVHTLNQKLEARVAQRTAEVEAANLELKGRYRENELLTELSKLLQSCMNVAEGGQVIANYGPQLFSRASGILYLVSPERKSFDNTASWGEPLHSEDVFMNDECWALRRGQSHVADTHDASLICQHVKPAPGGKPVYQCVPLLAQGETVGLLHLEYPESASRIPDAARRLATTLAEQLALALGNIQLRDTLRNQSIRDALTGLYNRRFLEESLRREFARAERKETPLALMMIDADHFKRFNDNYGHDGGDYVLQQLGHLLGEFIRESDIACRFGGEEFVLLLPGASAADATVRGAALLNEVRKLKLQSHGKTMGKLTVSIGLSLFPDHANDPELLLQTADSALYEAKRTGRDKLVVAGEKIPAVRKRAKSK